MWVDKVTYLIDEEEISTLNFTPDVHIRKNVNFVLFESILEKICDFLEMYGKECCSFDLCVWCDHV